jgi:hypothetical protein
MNDKRDYIEIDYERGNSDKLMNEVFGPVNEEYKAYRIALKTLKEKELELPKPDTAPLVQRNTDNTIMDNDKNDYEYSYPRMPITRQDGETCSITEAMESELYYFKLANESLETSPSNPTDVSSNVPTTDEEENTNRSYVPFNTKEESTNAYTCFAVLFEKFVNVRRRTVLDYGAEDIYHTPYDRQCDDRIREYLKKWSDELTK